MTRCYPESKSDRGQRCVFVFLHHQSPEERLEEGTETLMSTGNRRPTFPSQRPHLPPPLKDTSQGVETLVGRTPMTDGVGRNSPSDKTFRC